MLMTMTLGAGVLFPGPSGESDDIPCPGDGVHMCVVPMQVHKAIIVLGGSGYTGW